MKLRRTSSYLVLVSGNNETLDDMVAEFKSLVPIETTVVHPSGVVGFRFRCPSDDNAALNLALQIAHGRSFVLRTGYGVNQREIAQ